MPTRGWRRVTAPIGSKKSRHISSVGRLSSCFLRGVLSRLGVTLPWLKLVAAQRNPLGNRALVSSLWKEIDLPRSRGRLKTPHMHLSGTLVEVHEDLRAWQKAGGGSIHAMGTRRPGRTKVHAVTGISAAAHDSFRF